MSPRDGPLPWQRRRRRRLAQVNFAIVQVYVGSYASDILRFRRDPATGLLSDPTPAAKLANASWMIWHNDVLYAAAENEGGSVHAFRAGEESLGAQPTHGSSPCHLAVDPTGRYLLAANYGGGNVAVLPLKADGTLASASDVVELAAPGAHAHQIVFHKGSVLVTDLGNDEIRRYTLDDGRLRLGEVIPAPAGCGPRHLLPSDGYLFVAAELNATLLVFGADRQLLQSRPATVSAQGETYPSGLTFSPDLRFLYIANRGPNVISVFAVDGADPHPVADVPCGGDWPRDITFLGDRLYVANQRSDNIVVFEVDPSSGIPAPIGEVSMPEPARVVARPGHNEV